MSAVWIELITFLCLTCAALCDPERSAVVWKNPGEDLTIQCRVKGNVTSLAVSKGLNKDVQIFYKGENSGKQIIREEFHNRLQLNGKFPNLDFLIKNLTSADTGPYWCEYQWFDVVQSMVKSIKSEGSVLLVVRDQKVKVGTADEAGCETTHLNLVLVCVVVSVLVLLCIMVTLAWMFFKTKKLCSTVKPSQVAANDVYEDMRGRLHS